tara:strand:- start:294 stop:431 length:138 start_codon:yes stop_codon:yes gene_type:complete
MSEERPFLQLPLTSHEDMKLYEEWLKKKEQEKQPEEDDHVIVIDM